MWNPSCKNNIEEEEAAALAKVRSMVIDEVPHPPLFGLAPPTPQVLIHVQPSSKDKSHEVRTKSGFHSGQSHTYSIVGPVSILVYKCFVIIIITPLSSPSSLLPTSSPPLTLPFLPFPPLPLPLPLPLFSLCRTLTMLVITPISRVSIG